MSDNTKEPDIGCAGIIAIIGLVGLALFAILLFMSFTTIPAGHVGVVTSFGEVDKTSMSEGLHSVWFWKRLEKMSIQTQEVKETAETPSKEGLTVTLEASLLYSLEKEKAAEVYQTVGANYAEVVVHPQFRSALRSATVGHEAKDLYTASRAKIESDLEKTVHDLLAPRGIRCEKVLLRAITLPERVKTSIETKLAAEQDYQRMEFVIQKETREAERKRVEAKGIADAQKIIQGTLTDNYIRYLWVEALKTAAEHKTATIYVPTGHDGMPMVYPVPQEKMPKGD